MKPSDNQFKEFSLKLKSSNKELLFDYLIEKLSSYKNMTYGNNIKSFIVLYYNSETLICR